MSSAQARFGGRRSSNHPIIGSDPPRNPASRNSRHPRSHRKEAIPCVSESTSAPPGGSPPCWPLPQPCRRLCSPKTGISPWLQAVTVLQTAFTGPIARGLSLVAIVIGGLMFAFGEGGSKRALASLVFGVGMAIGAVNFMQWLFP